MTDQAMNRLKKELRQTGASHAELAELTAIATALSRLKRHTSRTIVNENVHTTSWLLRPLFGGLVGMTLGVLLIVLSQFVLPTSVLYPVQQFSDSTAIDIHSSYRANVMMKRAQQVSALVTNHASSGIILATLADYNRQAMAYEAMPHTNYAALEYCKLNLTQAAVHASPTVRQAIASSLQSLEST